MKRFNFIFSVIAIAFSFYSCKNEPQQEIVKTIAPVERKITDTTVFTNDMNKYSSNMGIIGLHTVPEMLVLSIIDSANANGMSEKLSANFALLEEELNAIGAEVNGPVGMITYNNNVKNFVFEAFICIKKIPSIQPRKSKIVVLEESQMLLFNFYGSYKNLFAAYDKIKKYCDKNDLLQTGPMREFYITDPGTEKDPQKWLTRIMLPVISMHSK